MDKYLPSKKICEVRPSQWNCEGIPEDGLVPGSPSPFLHPRQTWPAFVGEDRALIEIFPITSRPWARAAPGKKTVKNTSHGSRFEVINVKQRKSYSEWALMKQKIFRRKEFPLSKKKFLGKLAREFNLLEENTWQKKESIEGKKFTFSL